MLELTDYRFKIAVINMPRVLSEKEDNMQEQIGNISRKLKILRKNQNKL